MYKLQANFDANGNAIPTNTVIKDGRMWIPFDPDNTDAQQFAKWLQDGNLPEPAEEGGTVTQEWATKTISKLLPNG
jgi:hypothetical protein